MTAVGPLRYVPSPSSAHELIANRASRFLTTLYFPDTARSGLRTSPSSWTVRPRYSVITTVFTPSNRVFRSSPAVTFSCVGISDCLLEEVGHRLGIDGHARPHRRRQGQRLEV